MKWLITFFALCCIFCFPLKVNCANIVYLAPIPSPSHNLWNYKLIEALAERGHNVTVLCADKMKNPIKNVHVFDIVEIYDLVYGSNELNLQTLVDVGLFDEAIILYEFMYKFCEATGKTDGFQALLHYPDDFKVDLIINEFTVSSCLIGFLHKFKYPPLINVTPYKYTADFAERVGGHQYIGYIPRPVFPFSVNMTLMQRIQNFVIMAYENMYAKYAFQPGYDKLISKIFNITDLPSSYELDKTAAITLLNTHPATDYPVPLPPNVIEVGGFQIQDPRPVPNDIDEFFQKSKKGAVLISFGTNVRAHMFGDDKQKMVMDVVRKFPDYNFLWKFEKDPSEGKVTNLLVKSWVPQNDVLGHSKMKAFVSHGGGLSTQESVWHGVPMVAVPFFMDQKANAYQVVLQGVATYVNVKEFTVAVFEQAIKSILEDPSYMERMEKHSFRFRSRPMKPIDTAVWWVEYVLKDPNPVHLRSPMIYLGEFKAKSYDLIFYGLLLLLITYISLRYIKQVALKTLLENSKKTKTKLN